MDFHLEKFILAFSNYSLAFLYTFDTPNVFLPDKFNLFEVFSFLFTITLNLLSLFAATHEMILRYKMQ